MKLKALIVAAAVSLSAAMALCSCSDTSSKKAATPQKVAETVAETTTQGTESLPDTEFTELPDEAEADFDYVTEASSELFPDTSGKKMYGYTGLERIKTADGKKKCYIFEFYTYKSKLYNKVATIAKDLKSADIYILNELTGNYELAEIPEQEPSWHDQATAALAANTPAADMTESAAD